MAANIRCIMRAKAPYGQGITKMKVNFTPTQSGTPWQSDEVNNAPYVFRQIPMGNREWNKLVGGTVAWNQLCNSSSVTGTSGHKFYLKKGGAESITNTNTFTGLSNGTDMLIDLTLMLGSTLADYVYSLEQATAGSGIQWLKDYDLIDDQYHAYSQGSLESVNASAHVTVGKNLMNPDWSAWTVGNLYAVLADVVPKGEVARITLEDNDTSVSLSGCNMGFVYEDTGSTATQYRWVIANGVVQSNVTNISVVDSATLCSNVFIYPRTEETLNKFLARYNIMVELGTTATTYEPYVKHTYPLDSDLVLRGIPKLNNGNLYYDGDTYEWDGTVTRKYAEVAINGSSDWQGFAVGTGNASAYIVLDEEPYVGTAASSKNGAISNTGVENGKYWSVNRVNQVPDGGNMSFALGTSGGASYVRFCMTDVANITTLNAFKAAFPETQLQYLLATPTTESADPFTNPQVCDPDGTEEWTDYGVSQGTRDYAVPVGHESTYAMAYPIEGVDSFTVTANDGTTHTYPVSIGTTIYKGTVDVLCETYVSEMTNIASYNGETIGEPWLSSLDAYSPGATPTTGAQVVYTMSEPEEGPATVTGDPSTLSGVVSATSTEGTVDWNELSDIGIKCIMKRKNPFQ